MYSNFLLIPDSFKGTMSASEVCDILSDAIHEQIPSARVVSIPMADGGEGLTDTFLRLFGGEKIYAEVTGPLGVPVQGFFGLLPDGTGVLEMAAAAGLPLIKGETSPMTATTRGVGELLLHMMGLGVRQIIMGLGGSATTDGGIGMAAAMGWRFLDDDELELEPYALNLQKIRHIVAPERLPQITVSAACDVDNPLCGPTGAARVFGPQKGASNSQQEEPDHGLKNLAQIIEKDLGLSVESVPGSGAAGGLGAGVLTFLGGSLQSGIDLVLDAANVDQHMAQADIVITGEGRMDGQSVRGKVPYGVAVRAHKAGIPCLALCGSLGQGVEALYNIGITAMFSSISEPGDMEKIAVSCRQDYRHLANSVVRLLCKCSANQERKGM